MLIGLIQEHSKLGISDVLSGESSSIDDFIYAPIRAAGRGKGTSHHMHYLNPGPGRVIREQDLGHRYLSRWRIKVPEAIDIAKCVKNLRDVYLLQDLDKGQLQQIAQLCELQWLARGDFIIREDERGSRAIHSVAR